MRYSFKHTDQALDAKDREYEHEAQGFAQMLRNSLYAKRNVHTTGALARLEEVEEEQSGEHEPKSE